LTKPMPRLVPDRRWAPWGVGEHHPDTNPYGAVYRDAMLSSPCMGTSPGDPPYTTQNYGGYKAITDPGQPNYMAGSTLDAVIVLDADHNGDAQWSYCPHSEEAQTESCFRQRPLTDWIDVHAYWDSSNTTDHWKSGEHFPQVIALPADMPSGPVTLRWLWICKYTDEIFVSCLDTTILGGASTSLPVSTSQSPTTSTPSMDECIWTEPAGREVQRTPREEKDGRKCWDFVVEPGTTVYYQSNTDVYISWNADACCLSAATEFGSALAEPNIVSFTTAIGSFGFCECTAWDPDSPDTSCAGQATANNMVCPVLGATSVMCEETADWDGIPVACNPSYTGTTTDASTPTTSGENAAQYFQPVNGGSDQACRGSHSGDNSNSYFTLFSGLGSLSDCQAMCSSRATDCQGIEYHSSTGRCEVWTRAEGIQATAPVSGYSCFRYNPGSSSGTTSVAVTATTTMSTSTAQGTSCAHLDEQCGGDQYYNGPDCCVTGLKCQSGDESYPKCIKDDSSTYPCSHIYEQCGGPNWVTCCADGLRCKFTNDYYSQCVREVGSLAQHKVSSGRLRGPRSKKSKPHATMVSGPWLLQQGSDVSSTIEDSSEHSATCRP